MDFDGRELTRFYLEKQDLNSLLEVSRLITVFLKFTVVAHTSHTVYNR